MNQSKKTAAHIYTVELRLSGDELDPDEISTQLNLIPSNSFSLSKNEIGRKKRKPYWAYNGKGEIGFQNEWICLEEGLRFLTKILNPKKSAIISLNRKIKGVWWCGHFQSSFDGGPTISSQLLAEISSYELPLSIDNYFFDDEDEITIN